MEFWTEADVDAPPAALWAVLTNPTDWPRWTDSITSVELLDPTLTTGARVRVSQPGLRPMVWTVTEFTEGTGFAWTAVAGGVTTIGDHRVAPLDGGRRSRLVLGLRQRGLLAPLLNLMIGGRVRRYVELEAAGLQAAAEKSA
ncbi:SRPBCC family protein [Solwaraspora sp. WMMD1047]|uniref:SRPBCC family protein n=1 Tax=Solwaraspora sp. WMMD1047 TaxID=3016102 RepID=UPI0024170E35|nr:SRPBCC family protein [Solwaraspora sp. WMMD1047]MDG4832939.1 SRPBCC family protein [Solwaraspora sp. WMMD1047]